jgi:Holliday junction resolvase RusA-like endonuclease|uniref:Rus Holliday junction resolvase n=1 Tax=uncultured Caudovirales phage TaxID=2100421 RepID=A0A6J5KV63_9CAUD|nr:Rus Holliday junction resolvase [uncultured Caudovirales phage]
MIQLDIAGIPIPLNRPRCTKRGFVYDDQKSSKEQYRWQIRAQYRNQLLLGPIALDLTFFMPIPKSTSGIRRREMLNGVFYHIKKPDLDNLIKFVGDCLNGIVFEDDAQIAEIKSKKVYADRPGTLIRVHSLNEQQKSDENNL